MAFDLSVLLRLPPEASPTCLVMTLVLAFVLGVASVGALYQAVLRRLRPERALVIDAMPEGAATLANASPAFAFALVVLLVRAAFHRRSRA